MTTCEAVQDRLAELGAAAARDDEALDRHLEGCADCQAVLAALAELDAGLAGLPEHDATDALVAQTLAAVRAAGQPGRHSGRPRSINRPWIAGAMAASLVVLASVALIGELWEHSGFKGVELYRQRELSTVQPTATEPTARTGARLKNPEQVLADLETPKPVQSQPLAKEKSDLIVGGKVLGAPEEESARTYDYSRSLEAGQSAGAGGPAIEGFVDSPAKQSRDDDGRTGEYRAGSGSFYQEGDSIGEDNAPLSELELDEAGEVAEIIDDLTDVRRRVETKAPLSNGQSEVANRDQLHRGDRSEFAVDATGALRSNEATPGDSVSGKGAAKPDAEPESPPARALVGQSFGNLERQAGQDKKSEAFKAENKDVALNRLGREPGSASSARGKTTLNLSSETGRHSQVTPSNGAGAAEDHDDLFLSAGSTGMEQAYLNGLQTIDGLVFQEAAGYWSNSYIPGDPAIRLLEARLKAWNRTALGSDLPLERNVRPVVQPFDKPRSAGMALTLQADTGAIEGPTRLRLQVGLQGAERQGGRRPAMNVGLVLDLRHGADLETARRLRALVTALERATQFGDRFSLTVAGPNGGLVIAPGEFRHGPVAVALDQLFGDKASEGEATGLLEALSLATASLREGDRPEAVLGSSLLILATGSSLAGGLGDLEALAHNNAVAGLHTSVVSLGGTSTSEQIDRLVAAGQGNRRILTAPGEAERLVEKELYAATRAVARALRLRIRLAPGVKLVDVLGSHRLDEPRAQAVREAEQAIDQRLAQNLGIQADRGEDEEGIQIVIPNFFAGDSHVVLLDLVADKPGPIADVTLRYKDLVTLGNGVAQASLALPNGPTRQGPLERSVQKNLITWEFARQARLVGRDLRVGHVAAAQNRLATLRAVLQGLRGRIQGWAKDPDLTADETLLTDYLTALRSPGLQDPAQRSLLADSLDFAAHRKLLAAAR